LFLRAFIGVLEQKLGDMSQAQEFLKASAGLRDIKNDHHVFLNSCRSKIQVEYWLITGRKRSKYQSLISFDVADTFNRF
jgi:ATP/maltotriose-dependent transcriptional regulator MalT